MTKSPMTLQDLRRKIYVKAKAEPSWRFWGLYVHVCKWETLRAAYAAAKANDGAPGIDGVTFEAIEAAGVDGFLAQLRDELVTFRYRPLRNRRHAIPKDGGTKVRVLSIPAIRDRVVQGALKLILEPIFEADFQPGSFGYRPKRTAHAAVNRVAEAIVRYKTRVIDLDLRAYFDNVRHHRLLQKVAARVNDDDVMHLLKMMLTATGKKGVPQGGVISPLLSNIYLNEVDKMLERAKAVTRSAGGYTNLEYARFADDMVILVDGFRRWEWLAKAAYKRLQEELTKLNIQLNTEKTCMVDLAQGEVFQFLGFDIRPKRSPNGKWWAYKTPRAKARKKLLTGLKDVFRRYKGHSLQNLIGEVNPILRGWVNYYRIGNSSRCFTYVQQWVEKKVRRHIQRARQRKGFGWRQWSRAWLYESVGLFNDYHIRYYQARK